MAALLLLALALVAVSSVSGDFASDCLLAHNTLRQMHWGTPDLTWNTDLANEATNKGGSASGYSHAKQDPPGENFYEFWGLTDYYTTSYFPTAAPACAFAVFDWYTRGVIGYDYNLGYNYQTSTERARFVQVVWGASTQVGCAATLTNQYVSHQNTIPAKWNILCLYSAPGNTPTGNLYKDVNMVAPLKGGAQVPTTPGVLMADCQDMYKGCADLRQCSLPADYPNFISWVSCLSSCNRCNV